MPNCMLETTTALVVGDYVFIQTMGRVIYRVNYIEGPGEPDKSGNYPNVISMEGKAMKDITEDDKMPLETVDIAGKGYGYGMGSMIYSDGLILGKAHNGMFYAFDTDLHLVWSYQSTGSNYFTSVTCMYEMVFGGTLDGNIYVLDVNDGSLISNPQIIDIVKDTSAWDFSTSTITSKSTALYAKWTPVGQSFTVAFNMNGHGDQTASQTVPNGGRATEPADPAAEGFTFGGWYKDKECKKPWNFRTDVVSKDTTIYAKWTPVGQSFTVTFDMKGHGDPVAPLTVPDGGRIPVPADPTAEGYIFSGWYKDEKYSDPWNFRTNSVSADTTLYAKWVDGKASIDIAFNVLSRS